MKSIYATLVLLVSCLLVQAQNVGIGTTDPRARLHVVDSSVLFTGSINAPTLNNSNPPIQGAGTRMMWFPAKGAFRSGYVSGNKWDSQNIGLLSTALGIDTEATEEASLASGIQSKARGTASSSFGYGSIASGFTASSFGLETIASGSYSLSMGAFSSSIGSHTTSMGFRTLAIGDVSVAIGEETEARAYASFSAGTYNDNSDNPTSGILSPSDRLFQIGNGTFTARQNAFTILRNGNIGIGTTTPSARLQVRDSAVLFTGPLNAPVSTNINTPAQGLGTRMMWFPALGAFRSGYVAGSKWDRINIGAMSTAIGYDTEAKEYAAFASGYQSRATGFASTSFGYGSTASGFSASSFGTSTIATGQDAISMGSNSNSSGLASTSMGYITNASGNFSISMGNGTFAKANGSFAAGTYNDNTDNPSPTIQAPSDRLFQIGNGTITARQNALTILRNGNTGIGISNPQKFFEVVGPANAAPVTLVIGNKGGFGPSSVEFVSDYGLVGQWRPGYIRSNDLGNYTGRLEFYTNGTGNGTLYGNVKGFEVRNGIALTATGTISSYSDARLKHSITSFTDGLNVINKINPVQFYYNADAPFASEKKQIGIIAQELELLAPYMVEQNKEGKVEDMRTVNNQAYTFLLINAVKEQQVQIEQYKTAQQKQEQQLQAYQSTLIKLQSEIDFLKQSVQQILNIKK